jgi:hypothetical protein
VWRCDHSNSCSGNPNQKVCVMPFKTSSTNIFEFSFKNRLL